MNEYFLNEYFGFCFELNFELNHFWAKFNEKMNFPNVSNRAMMIRPDSFTFCSYFLRLIIMIIGGRSDQISSTFCSHFSSTPSTPANQGQHPQGEYLLCFLFCCLSLQYLHNGSEIIQDGYFFHTSHTHPTFSSV